MFVLLSVAVNAESGCKIDSVEDKINSCLSDIGGDVTDVVDVIRKAITTDDDDTKFVVVVLLRPCWKVLLVCS